MWRYLLAATQKRLTTTVVDEMIFFLVIHWLSRNFQRGNGPDKVLDLFSQWLKSYLHHL